MQVKKKLNHETQTVKLPIGSMKAEVLRIRLQPAHKHRVNPIKSHGTLLERDDSKPLQITMVESLWVELWCDVVQVRTLEVLKVVNTSAFREPETPYSNPTSNRKLYLQDLGHADVHWLRI